MIPNEALNTVFVSVLCLQTKGDNVYTSNYVVNCILRSQLFCRVVAVTMSSPGLLMQYMSMNLPFVQLLEPNMRINLLIFCSKYSLYCLALRSFNKF